MSAQSGDCGLPQTDEEARAMLARSPAGIAGQSAAGIYQILRVRGASVFDAYVGTPNIRIGIYHKQNDNG